MKFTYKFFGAGEIKQLDEAEVVSCHQVDAGTGNTSAVNVRLLSVTRPNTENLVTQDARETKNHRCDHYLVDPTASLYHIIIIFLWMHDVL